MDLLQYIDTWKLLGGLGVFLFAMFTIEDAIRKLAGRSFKRFIRHQTNGTLRSILSGTVATAILQSSSAVSLMVLAFVGAGIMAMENAIGVILGSNIGTTATAWIVASVGFKFNIEAFSLPMIGVGGLILIFLGKSQWYSNFSRLLVGFGFLFMGLSFMKDSMNDLAENISLEELPQYGVFVYLIIGMLLTAAMQSSSAAIALVLTGIHAGLISFESAAGMVIGANIGTTATVLIGGIRATQIKKRVAASHLFFNLISAVLGLILLWPLTWLIREIVGDLQSHAVIAVALFHTLFNVVGVLFFLPFIHSFSRLLMRVIPDKKSTVTEFIHRLAPSVYDAAESGLRNEVERLVRETMEYNRGVLGIHIEKVRKGIMDDGQGNMRLYQELKLIQSEIFRFSTEIQNNNLSQEENMTIVKLMHSARESLNAAKSIKDIEHNVVDFEGQDNKFLYSVINNLKERMQKHYDKIETVMNMKDHSLIARESRQLLKQISNEDREYVSTVMKAVKEEQNIGELLLSEILLVNREFIHSSRLLIHAVLELRLDDMEMNFFENLTE